jgi:hypothetical protein
MRSIDMEQLEYTNERGCEIRTTVASPAYEVRSKSEKK